MEDIFANLPTDPSVFDATSGLGSAVDFDTDSVFLHDTPSMYATDMPSSSVRSNPTPSPNANATPEHDYFSKPSPQLLSAAPTPPPPPPPSQPSPSPPPPPPPTQAHPPSQPHPPGPALPPSQELPPSQALQPSQAIQQSRANPSHQVLQQSQVHPSSQSSHPSSQPPPPPPTQPQSQAQVRSSQLAPPVQAQPQRQVAQSSGTQSRHPVVSSAALFAQQACEKQVHHHGHSPATSTASQPPLFTHTQPPPPPPTVAQPSGPTVGMHAKQQTAALAGKLNNHRSGMDESTSLDSERLALRSTALAVVADSWRAAAIPAHFVASVCARLPSRSATNLTAVVDDSGLSRSPNLTSPSCLGDSTFDAWLLPSPSEGAILDALFSKIVNSEVPSTRFLNYLSHSLLTGIVSQRSVVSTCLHWIGSTPGVSDHVLQAFTRLMVRIIPHYRFTIAGLDLTVEIKDFLAAFHMIVNCTAKSPSLAPDLVSVLAQERVITLVRACARRVPTFWPRLHTALEKLDTAAPPPPHMGTTALPTQSAISVAPYLKPLVTRLTYGLAVGITSLDTIAASIGPLPVPAQEASIPTSLQYTYTIALHVFGNDVAVALRELLSKREPLQGDLPVLTKLERAAKIPGVNGTTHSSVPAKYAFRNNVQACEAIVRFIAERATERWSELWGGKDRLKRIIVNALPQIKTEIMSETGALIVAMAVTCCAAMCLGPALRVRDANDGVEPRDANEAELIQRQNEEVEDAVGELTSFSVFILEEAATAEETPLWRSFGLWLLLLMSRTGCLLRACGCDHVRAARVLRAWSGVPTGTPGTHTSHSSSGHKSNAQGSGSNNNTQQPSSSAASQTEGISMFATSASLAIIDASDVCGRDETIQALCDDLVQ